MQWTLLFCFSFLSLSFLNKDTNIFRVLAIFQYLPFYFNLSSFNYYEIILTENIPIRDSVIEQMKKKMLLIKT